VVERSVRTLNCSSRRAAYTPEPPGSFRAKQLSHATFKVLIERGYSFRGNALQLFVRWSGRLAQKQTLRSALCSRFRKGPYGVNFCEHNTRVIETADERLLINWRYFCGKSGRIHSGLHNISFRRNKICFSYSVDVRFFIVGE